MEKCERCDYVKHPVTDAMVYCNKLKCKVYRYSVACRCFQQWYEPF